MNKASIIGAGLAAALAVAVTPAHAAVPAAGKIAFSTDFGPDPQLYTVNPDGSGETQITRSADGIATNPAFTSDGTKLVFQGNAAGDWQLYEASVDGTGRRLLFSDPGVDDLQPRISPDGTRITFARCPLKITCVIETARLDGTDMKQLTSLVWNSGHPVWSPDGTRIAFESNQDSLLSAVWAMGADGTQQRRLTAPELEAFGPDWSPDGSRMLFTDLCCLFGSNAWVMSADGSTPRQLTHFPTGHQGGFASYSPDGKRVVLIADLKYRDNCCGDLYTMDANGTHLTRIVTDQPAVASSDWGPAPSPRASGGRP